MIKKTLITFCVFIMCLTSFAQKEERQERLKAYKIAFITEKLNLTEDEAQKFWPIYNAHEKEVEMLRHNAREKRRNLNIRELSENEALTALEDMMAFEKEQLNHREDLIENLKNIIPAIKIIKLQLAEKAFNQRMLEEFKNRREKFKRRN